MTKAVLWPVLRLMMDGSETKAFAGSDMAKYDYVLDT